MTPVPEDAEALLRDATVMAHLATCNEGFPHVAPVWYVYDDGVVELTTVGRKLANVRANPKVALSMQKDVDGETQWMVSLLGTATVVEDDAQVRQANRRINEKYGADEDAFSENTLVRVDVGSASYRTY
jgi:nitroimidazol reductase NimA-like FMN-containing flavoprotein (pyridoxamine 5'-phosphate oxidase superfamily)